MDADCRVTACTANSFTLLGIQPETLDTSEKPRISEWVSNWAASEGALSRGAEVRLCVQEQNQQVGPRHGSSSNGVALSSSSSLSGRKHFVIGHLQRIPIPGGVLIHVLHWRHEAAAKASLLARRVAGPLSGQEEGQEESQADAVVAYGRGSARSGSSGRWV